MAKATKRQPAKKKITKGPPPGMHMMPGEKMPMKNSDMAPMDRELKTRYPSMFEKTVRKKR